MTDTYSTILEFKLVDNFLRIVNNSDTFSFDEMIASNSDYVIIPVSQVGNTVADNINQSTHCLKPSVAVPLLYYNEQNTQSGYVSPNPFALIAQGAESGNQGIVVSINAGQSPQITIGSTTQMLKGVFLCKIGDDYEEQHSQSTDMVVLAYCILPEPVPVRNYIMLPSDGLVIEIDSVLNVSAE